MSNSDSRRNSEGKPLASQDEAPAVQTGRRQFLKFAGLSLAAASLPEWLASCGSSPAGAVGERTASTSLNYTVDPSAWKDVVRPEDMLRLRFNFVQLTTVADSSSPSGKSLSAAGMPGLILVEFPPQHIVEPTVNEPLSGPPTSVPEVPLGVGSSGPPPRISQPTQLAFVVPAGTSVPYDLEGLLTAVTGLDLNTAPNAYPAGDDKLPAPATTTATSDPDGALAILKTNAQTSGQAAIAADFAPPAETHGGSAITPAAPTDSQTSIELPYRVILSPSSSLRFAHSAAPYQPDPSGLTEMWTSRLARQGASSPRASEPTRAPLSVRAIYSPDSSSPADPFPGQMALDAGNRAALVTQTSDFNSAATAPVHARSLSLSARGGSLDTYGDWGDSPVANLNNWQHRASFGRDNYVRVEVAGILFPYWHVASYVIVAERKFLANPGGAAGPRTAFLWERHFVVIRQPVINYTTIVRSRRWAFQQIRILSPSTPPLDPAPTPLAPFWPTINGVAFRFAAQFVDLEGNISKSNLAAIFVPLPLPSSFTALQQMFEQGADTVGLSSVLRCTSDFQRQGIAYAPTAGPTATTASTIGKTTFETQTMQFDVELSSSGSSSSSSGSSSTSGSSSGIQIQSRIPFSQIPERAFWPIIKQTQVAVPSLRQFTGSDRPISLEYPDAYANAGFPDSGGTSNAGEVFLSLVAGQAPGFADFGSQSQRGGAFLAPNLNIVGLSRQLGPISGVPDATGDVTTQINNFASTAGQDPSLLFGAVAGALSNAKLFGCFNLMDLFGGAGKLLSSLPKFATETLDVVGTLLRTVQQVQSQVQALQSAVGSLPTGGTLPPLPAAFTKIQGQLTTLGDDFQKFVTDISALPPQPPATVDSFIQTAQGDLQTLQTDVNNLLSSVSGARSATPGLPQAQQLADSAFTQADSLLRSAAGILSSAGSASGDLQKALNAIATLSDAATNLTSHFSWSTNPGDIKPINLGSFTNVFSPQGTKLTISGEVRAHEVAGKPAGLDLTASLSSFNVNLLGDSPPVNFLQLQFDHITFTSMAGQKPTIDVGFSNILFEGQLHFLNALQSIIPLNGFSDPPGITVDSSGITGNFGLSLPSLAVGVFALENISLGAKFNIPFIGESMTVGFNFCTRENPFHLTVSLLGGGGYVMLTMSMRGVVLIEAALEFGAEASIDLVVVSGSVLVMGGVSFSYTPSGVLLSGYVRIAGSLSVLGLITASVEMRLTLTYQPSPEAATGTATISIEVSIMFFSTSVDVTCSKTFGNCNGDPTFLDTFGDSAGNPTPDWNEYFTAFAA